MKRSVRTHAAEIIYALQNQQSNLDALLKKHGKALDDSDRRHLQALCYGLCREWFHVEAIEQVLLEKPLKARFLKLVNHHVPDGTFALTGFRVFGKADGKIPAPVNEVTVKRNKSDRREVEIFWTESKNATGYLVRFGNHSEKLYQSQIVYGSSFVKIRRLNAKQNYFFTVDAFNENGVARGEKIFN